MVRPEFDSLMLHILYFMKTLNKRVKVTVPARDDSGFGFHPTKKAHIVGQCEFFGINEVFGVLQITVDRTPIFPILESQIEVLK